ncbi:MAG: tetratricopeptide repeat protein [Promethearchaeota archaeon]
MDENTPLSELYDTIINNPSILKTIGPTLIKIEIRLKGDIKALDQFYETIIDGYFLIGRSTECFDFTKRWLLIHTDPTQHIRGFAVANHTMGTLYQVFDHNLQKAEEYYKNAYNITKDSTDLGLRDMMIYNMGNINQHHKGDYLTAYPYYQEGAENAHQQNKHIRKAFFVDHMAMSLHWQGKFEEALKLLQQSREIVVNENRGDHTLYNKMLESLVYLELHNYPKALQEMLSVFDIKITNSDGFTHNDYLLCLSDIAREMPGELEKYQEKLEPILEGSYSEADIIDKAVAFAETNGRADIVGKSYLYKVKLLWKSDKTEEAKKLLEKGYAIINKNYRGEIVQLYNDFIYKKQIVL